MVIVTRTKNKQKEEELFERREKLLEEWKKRFKNENGVVKDKHEKHDDEDDESRFFHDLLNSDSKNLYHDYEVFFRGSMPDIGIVNATGNFQKVELGTAQPPFQYVTSHASSTILIDKNGDFYGLGANSEGQLGDWGLIGNMTQYNTAQKLAGPPLDQVIRQRATLTGFEIRLAKNEKDGVDVVVARGRFFITPAERVPQ